EGCGTASSTAPYVGASVELLGHEPAGAAARQVAGAAALGDDPGKSHPAGLLEDGLSLAFEMRVESDCLGHFSEKMCERPLAVLDHIPACIEAVHLQQIECMERDLAVPVQVP